VCVGSPMHVNGVEQSLEVGAARCNWLNWDEKRRR
jgi:hypothetical protein